MLSLTLPPVCLIENVYALQPGLHQIVKWCVLHERLIFYISFYIFPAIVCIALEAGRNDIVAVIAGAVCKVSV